jgi:hypothetical protein
MLDFYQKRKLRAIINSRYTQAFILLLALSVGYSTYVRFDIAMEMMERRKNAEQQAAALLERKETLSEKVEYLSSDRGLEAEMRRQFDVALPGEQVIVIVEEEESEDPVVQPVGSSTERAKRRWYEVWR